MNRISLVLILLLSLFSVKSVAQFKISDLMGFAEELGSGGNYNVDPQQSSDLIQQLAAQNFIIKSFEWQQEIDANGNYDNGFLFNDVNNSNVHENLEIDIVEPKPREKGELNVTITDTTDSYVQYVTWLSDLKAMTGYSLAQQNPFVIQGSNAGVTGEKIIIQVEILTATKSLPGTYQGGVFLASNPAKFRLIVERIVEITNTPVARKAPKKIIK